MIRLRDRRPPDLDLLEAKILNSGINFVAPDVEQASLAAQARLRYPLNLGDCFAYALAKTRRFRLLTLDTDFRATDIQIVCP